MINAILVDDKPVNIEILQTFLLEYCPVVHVAGSALTIEDAYTLIRHKKPELVFLDIELTDGTGFDLLKRFKNIDFEVIFTTAYNQYAIQAFRENAVDYLLKPVDIELLQDAVEKAQKRINLKSTNERIEALLSSSVNQTDVKISVPTQEGFIFIPVNDIWYCEASGSYSYLHMKSNKKILISLRLKECESILPAAIFFRVHNSYLVNTQHIRQYIKGRGGFLVMENGEKIEVAVSRKDEFLKFITGSN
jgi:two-component system LytT family response regulator